MKKIFFVQFLIVLFLFSSCGFQLPERFGVKTGKAQYNFAITDKSFDLSEYFSVSSILKQDDSDGTTNGDEMFDLYDYNPGGNAEIQQFLMKMDVQDIPLDFSNSFSDTDVVSSVQNMTVSKDIEIPTINIAEKKDVEVNVNKNINNLVKIVGFTGPELNIEVNFEDPNNNFERVSYTNGYMKISENQMFTNEKISGKILLYYEGQKVSEAEFENGVALLPLNNVTIAKTGLTFKFTESNNVPFTAEVVETSVVKEAIDITLQDSVPVEIKTTFEIKNDSALQSCQIADGNIEAVFNTPELWQNIDIDYTLALSGGLSATLTDENVSDSLNGQYFDNSDIDVTINATIIFNHSNITFIDDSGKNINPNVDFKVEINELASATVKLDSDYNPKFNQSELLPETVLEKVKSVNWNKCGFEISCINTLPVGNEIGMKITSDFLGFDNKYKNIPHSTSINEPEKITDFITENMVTVIGNEVGQVNSVDFEAELSLPGFDTYSKTLTIVNIVPGETYKLDLVISPVFDWKSMVLKSLDTRVNDTISTQVNLSSLFESFEESIGNGITESLEIKRLPIYLFCEVPELGNVFSNAKFNGVIKAYIGDDGNNPVGEKEEYLLGSFTDGVERPSQLSFANAPKFTADENKLVKEDLNLDRFNSINLAELLNEVDINGTHVNGSLCVSYDVRFETGDSQDELEITKEQIDELSKIGPTSIKLTVLGVVPFEFGIKNDINMDLLKMVGNDTDDENYDLLGREDGSALEDYDKFIDLIESVSLTFKPTKLPFIFSAENDGDAMKLIVDLSKDPLNPNTKELDISGDTVTLIPDDILTFPFNPGININFPKGTLSIPRNMEFSTKLFLGITTSEKILWLDELKNDNGGNE